jgi:hypothetical protein
MNHPSAERAYRVDRVVLAVMVVFGWIAVTRNSSGVTDFPHPVGLVRFAPIAALRQPLLWAGLTGALFVGLVGVVRNRRVGLSVALVGGLLLLAGHVDLSVRDTGMPGLDLVLAANLFLAWGLGWAAGRRSGHADTWGFEAACGVLGATLTLAGLSKLGASGVQWFNDASFARMAFERAAVDSTVLGDLRLRLSQLPHLATVGGLFTMVVDLGAVALAFQRTRRAFAALVLVWFASNLLLLGVYQPAWWAWLGWLVLRPRFTAVDGPFAAA